MKKVIETERLTRCKECKGTRAQPGSISGDCYSCHGAGVKMNPLFPDKLSKCNTCKGIGKIINEKCLNCGGEGLTLTLHTVEMKIPRFVRDKQEIELPL